MTRTAPSILSGHSSRGTRHAPSPPLTLRGPGLIMPGMGKACSGGAAMGSARNTPRISTSRRASRHLSPGQSRATARSSRSRSAGRSSLTRGDSFGRAGPTRPPNMRQSRRAFRMTGMDSMGRVSSLPASRQPSAGRRAECATWWRQGLHSLRLTRHMRGWHAP